MTILSDCGAISALVTVLSCPAKLIPQREALSGASVQLHSRIASYGEARAIGIEGVAGGTEGGLLGGGLMMKKRYLGATH